MQSTTLSQKYQVVIPTAVRKAMSLKTGQKVYIKVFDKDKALLLKQPKNHTDELVGLGKAVWTKLGGADSYIKKERGSWGKK